MSEYEYITKEEYEAEQERKAKGERSTRDISLEEMLTDRSWAE